MIAPPTQSRLPSLDGLRAFAIALVLAGHASLSVGWPFAGGPLELYANRSLLNSALGVRVFFVISGFLITTLLLKEEQRHSEISLRAFYVRRGLRILPVLWTYCAVVGAFELAIGRRVLDPFLHALTFTTGGFFDGHSSAALAHTWSLSVEEQFYIAWPLILASTPPRLRMAVAIGLTLVALPARAYAYLFGVHWLTYQTIFGHIDQLMVGCSLALIWMARPALVRTVVLASPGLARALALGLLFGVQLVRGAGTAWFTVPLRPLVEALCVAYLIASTIEVRTGVLFSILNAPALCRIGVLSYSLYVWQQLPLYPAGNDGYEAFWLQRFPQNLPLVALCAVISYYAVERPFLRLKERWERTGAASESQRTGRSSLRASARM